MTDNRFMDIRLPDFIAVGATGGPLFKTTIAALSSGFEKANQDWKNAKAKYDIGHVARKKPMFLATRDFFYVARGMFGVWRFHDHLDDDIGSAGSPQSIGAGDGSRTVFQIYKRYQVGSYIYDRPIQCIRSDEGYTVYADGVQLVEGAGAGKFTIDRTLGQITYGTPPASSTGFIGRFDVPCRFDTDWGNFTMDIGGPGVDDGIASWPSLSIVSYRIRP